MAKSATTKRTTKVTRGIKSRSKDTYSNEAYGRGDSSMPMNDHCINPAVARVNLFRPKSDKGITKFRPWPAMDYHGELKLERGRTKVKSSGLGHFIQRAVGAVFVGRSDGQCEKHTWICHMPNTTDEEKNNHPYNLLYWKAFRAEDSGKWASGKQWNPEWNRLLKGSKKGGGQGADLSRPKGLYFMQGEIYLNGEKDFLEDRKLPLGGDPDDDLVVLELSQGAGLSLFDLFGKEKTKEWDGDTDKNPALPYLYGDPCGVVQPDGSLKGGWFYDIWHPGKYKQYKPAGRTSWKGEVKEQQGYEIALTKEYKHDGKLWLPDMDADRVKNILQKWQFWIGSDDGTEPGLLYVAPLEEQCLWIAKCFKTTPGLLQQAWADHPEFMTDEVKAVLKARAQVVVPGSEDEYDEEEDKPKGKKKARKDVTAGKPDPEDEPEEDEVEEDDVEESDEDEDEEDEFEEAEEAEEAEESEDEDEEEAEEAEDEEAEEEAEEEEEEEEEEPAPKKSKKGKKAEPEPEPEEESEEDEESDEDEEEESEEDEEEEGDEEEEAEEEEAEEVADEFFEEGGDSAEFEPEAEVNAKTKAMKASLAKATGSAEKRAASRSSKAQDAPTPPAKEKTGKSTKAPAAASAASKAPFKGKTPPKTAEKPVKGKAAPKGKPAAAPPVKGKTKKK